MIIGRALFSLIGFLMLAGTALEAYQQLTATSEDEEDRARDEDSVPVAILKSFSILSNGSKILSSEAGSANLGCINGIRFG